MTAFRESLRQFFRSKRRQLLLDEYRDGGGALTFPLSRPVAGRRPLV